MNDLPTEILWKIARPTKSALESRTQFLKRMAAFIGITQRTAGIFRPRFYDDMRVQLQEKHADPIREQILYISRCKMAMSFVRSLTIVGELDERLGEEVFLRVRPAQILRILGLLPGLIHLRLIALDLADDQHPLDSPTTPQTGRNVTHLSLERIKAHSEGAILQVLKATPNAQVLYVSNVDWPHVFHPASTRLLLRPRSIFLSDTHSITAYTPPDASNLFPPLRYNPEIGDHLHHLHLGILNPRVNPTLTLTGWAFISASSLRNLRSLSVAFDTGLVASELLQGALTDTIVDIIARTTGPLTTVQLHVVTTYMSSPYAPPLLTPALWMRIGRACLERGSVRLVDIQIVNSDPTPSASARIATEHIPASFHCWTTVVEMSYTEWIRWLVRTRYLLLTGLDCTSDC